MAGAVRRAGAAAARADGLAVAYLMGVLNALLACLAAFGVPLTDAQSAAIAVLVNACLVAGAHLLKAHARTAHGGPPPFAARRPR